jgi:hypothetical protein
MDILLEQGPTLTPVEIRSGSTVASDFFSSIDDWRRITGQADSEAWLIYGGDRRHAWRAGHDSDMLC